MAGSVKAGRKVRRSGPRLRRPNGGLSRLGGGLRRGSGLLIGGEQDPAEKAAYCGAERVMRLAQPVPGLLCSCAGTGEREPAEAPREKQAAKRRHSKDSEEEVHAKGGSGSKAPGSEPQAAIPARAKAIASLAAGRCLESAKRAFLEPRFGKNRFAIGVDEGEAAERSSRTASARALVLGKDIGFARGASKGEMIGEKGTQKRGLVTPRIHRVEPRKGRVGDEVEVLAHGVGETPAGRHRLFLGDSEITTFVSKVAAGSSVKVHFKLPAQATSGELFFENNGIRSNRVKFTVLP